MAIYEYECDNEGHIFEVEQKMSDDPLKKCIYCNGKVRRLISAPTVFVKGSEKHKYVKDFMSDDRKWDTVREVIWGYDAKKERTMKEAVMAREKVYRVGKSENKEAKAAPAKKKAKGPRAKKKAAAKKK